MLNSATELIIPGISRGITISPSVESVSGNNSLYLTNYSLSLNWQLVIVYVKERIKGQQVCSLIPKYRIGERFT